MVNQHGKIEDITVRIVPKWAISPARDVRPQHEKSLYGENYAFASPSAAYDPQNQRITMAEEEAFEFVKTFPVHKIEYMRYKDGRKELHVVPLRKSFRVSISGLFNKI